MRLIARFNGDSLGLNSSSTTEINLQYSNNTRLKIHVGSNFTQFLTQNDVPLLFKTDTGTGSGTEHLRITSAGKVGIGTISPNTLLHIQDAAISGYGSQSGTLLIVEDTGDTQIEIASGYNNTGSIFFGDTGASNKGRVSYHHGTGGDAMSFHANGSERMRIASDGKLSIDRTHASATTGNSSSFRY